MHHDLITGNLVGFKDIYSVISDRDSLISGVCSGSVPRSSDLQFLHSSGATEISLNQFDKTSVVLLLALKDILFFQTFTAFLE